jgi:hypothetical protein
LIWAELASALTLASASALSFASFSVKTFYCSSILCFSASKASSFCTVLIFSSFSFFYCSSAAFCCFKSLALVSSNDFLSAISFYPSLKMVYKSEATLTASALSFDSASALYLD